MPFFRINEYKCMTNIASLVPQYHIPINKKCQNFKDLCLVKMVIIVHRMERYSSSLLSNDKNGCCSLIYISDKDIVGSHKNLIYDFKH